MSRPTLLIPVVFPDPEVYPLDQQNLVGLDEFDVVLFGYWEIPAGTSPETARDVHETEAEAVLYEMAAQFSRAGSSTDVQLHFGRPGEAEVALQNRIAAETDADAVLVPKHLTMWHNVLVPLRDDRRLDDVVEFLSAFDRDSMFVIELFHAAPDREATASAEAMLADVKDRLMERGFSDDDVETTVVIAENASRAIAEQAEKHNLVVMGETDEPDDPDRFFGSVYADIADETDTPIAVLLGTT